MLEKDRAATIGSVHRSRQELMTGSAQREQQAPHTVVGRFAPSPSGRMHLGNIFSALAAWLSVRAQNGRLILRIEDLDPRCANPDRARQLIDDLRWLGLCWDEGPVYQHDRMDLYREALADLTVRSYAFATGDKRAARERRHARVCRNLSPPRTRTNC